MQEVLESAMSTLLRKEISVLGAGRTDAGVHARQMFAHFDVKEPIAVNTLIQRLNSFLPDDIAVRTLVGAKSDAHARFDAVARTYEYWIVQKKNPFYSDSAHFVWSQLDMTAMNRAADILKEYEDFECFSKSNTDVKTFICQIKEAFWIQEMDRLVFTITADRFLRNMVRAIVGTL